MDSSLQIIMILDSNIKSKSLYKTYLNIIKIFNKFFKYLNIESRNLEVTSTWKKGHFKLTGKITSVTDKILVQ